MGWLALCAMLAPMRALAVLTVLALSLAAPALAGDEALVLRPGDRITHAVGNLYRIQDSHDRVKGYIEKDPVNPEHARVTDRAGNTISTIPEDLLPLDPDDDGED